MEKKKHSKYYYDYDRNRSTTLDQYDADKSAVLDNNDRIPEYYKGKEGYEARKVCDNFELPYHLASAVTYLLRAYHKHDTPVDCIKKAIAHLEFELDKIERDS